MRCPCNDANCIINKLDAELQEARKAAREYLLSWMECEQEFNKYCRTPHNAHKTVHKEIKKYPWLKEEEND